jgi:Fe-S-cluster-containing hydrogenase component 2
VKSAPATRVLVVPENCSGCLRCALACSFYTTPEREFNVSRSRIMILPGWDQRHFEVTLTDECTHCGICVQYCEFGALSRVQNP